MSDYAAERYHPNSKNIGHCTPKDFNKTKSNLYIFFDGYILTLSGGKKTHQYAAVSGKPEQGKFSYTLERQKAKNIGPIPEGTYWINPDEIWENAWYKRASRESWGDYRVTIHPYPNTETHGRGGFFIHGGKYFGSIGCIDLTIRINNFIEDLRNELNGNKNCYVPTTVMYRKVQ